ncbi:MAG: T9SS type A sorting domain-containing protein [Bacteroidetes bacterium]|nr:T9SS type A sorting domain-containing protein [Bacteroidota bacterium]
MLAGTPNGVFLSNNGGTSWTAINNGLSNTNVHCVAILYGKFLVGTDAGVFVSKDQGSSWHQNPTDLIKSVVTTFVIYEYRPFENILVAGTQMQGVFYIGNYLEFSSVEEQPLVEMPEVHISPNPASDHITVEFENETTDCRIILYDLYGSCVGSYSVGSGRSTIKTDNLSSGVYTLRVQVGGRIASRTVAIIK